MKTSSFLHVAAACFFPFGVGVPMEQIATHNPLQGFPALNTLHADPALYWLDPDGVYRAYQSDGTVIDAARVTKEQVLQWVNAREPQLSPEEADDERATYENIDPSKVPDDQLLHPAESIKPNRHLKSIKEGVSRRSPLIGSAPYFVGCPAFYCGSRPKICDVYIRCICNGVVCYG